MKRFFCVFAICALLCLCAGCGKETRETVYAMNTVMDLQLWGEDAPEGMTRIKTLLNTLEKDWSAREQSSRLSAMNRGEQVSLTDEEQDLFAAVEALSARTGGAFDPKLFAVSSLWGFGTEHTRVPAERELEIAKAEKKWDLGGALKGYAGQQATQLLTELRVERALLNLGGNIQSYGEKPDGTPWRIGIQNPDGGDYLGVVSVSGTAAVVTSGDYQRYFEQDGLCYHHILDPETGKPAASGLRSVTVICRDGLTADALSTALFVMGLEKSTDFWRQSQDFEAVFVAADGKIYATQGAALSGCAFEELKR